MDAAKFIGSKTGQLVRITIPGGIDTAFLPDPLPPAWRFPDSLWPLLAEAREQLVKLNERGMRVKNPSLMMTPLRRREALRSSSLEGTYATAEELLLFEMAPQKTGQKGARVAEWQEVKNYDAALKHGCSRILDRSNKGLPLSLRLIKEMHGLLMKDVRGNTKLAGEFRTTQNHVGSDRRYVPPPPEYLGKMLDQFEKFLHDHGDNFDPLVLSFLVHYQFEAIHPFLDGNGRIGRALLSLTVYQWRRLDLPWLYLSAFFEKYKDEYIDRLFRVSTHGDWDGWIAFCLRGTIEQCRDSLRRCDLLNSIDRKMRSELGGLPRMHSIIDNVFFRPIFTVADVAQWCNSSRPTAREDIGILIMRGFAEHLTGKRPRTYLVRPIFDAAYSEDEKTPVSASATTSP